MNVFFAVMGGIFVGAFMASLLGLGFLYGLVTATLAAMLIHQTLKRRIGPTSGPRTYRTSPWQRARREHVGARRPRHGRSALGPFTISLVALAAKMAKADGRVSTAEIRAFRRVVEIPPDQEATVAEIFNEAKRTAQGFEPFAIKLRDAVLGDPAILGQVLNCLHDVAAADGPVTESERQFLAGVEHIFSLGSQRAGRQSGRRESGRRGSGAPPPPPGGAAAPSPHAVLGLPSTASVSQIKAAYRDLARKHHPDYLQAQGLSKPMIDAAHEEMVKINAAYDDLKSTMGFR